MKSLKKRPDKKSLMQFVLEINEVLAKKSLPLISGKGHLSTIRDKPRSLTDVEKEVLAIMGEEARELWVDWGKYKALKEENQNLKAIIVDLTPDLFKRSWRHDLFRLAILTIVLSVFGITAILWRYGPEILDLEVQKRYSGELLEAQKEKYEAMLDKEMTIQQMIELEKADYLKEIDTLNDDLDKANEEISEIKKQLGIKR